MPFSCSKFCFRVPAKTKVAQTRDVHLIHSACCDSSVGIDHATFNRERSAGKSRRTPYHRRPIFCCSLAGDNDNGGLDMEMPVAGLTMGIALRPRVAVGW